MGIHICGKPDLYLRQAELFRWVGGFVVGVALCAIQATEKIRLPPGVRRLVGIHICGKPNFSDG
jgi:hypothetical protein